MFEITMENYSSDIHIDRGGCFHHRGDDYSISYRSVYGNNSYTGFRPALYIKM